MFANEELESLYSPSQWSKRYSSEEVVEKHIQFLNEHSAIIRKVLPCTLNTSYGSGRREFYDIFGTDLNDDSPILIHIHGGYYQEETVTHANNSFISRVFYKHGIKTILLGYELSPKRSVVEIMEHILIGLQRCIRYAKALNSRGVYLSGHSAGAHAIATVLTNLRKTLANEECNLIKAAFLISGLYNMEPVTKMSANQILNLSEETAREQLSPYFDRLEYGNTRMCVIAGEHDSPSFIKQAKQFYKKLRSENISTELDIVPNVDHFDIVEKLYYEDYELTKLIINTINKKY